MIKQYCKKFWHISKFERLHNYFEGPTKLFSDLYLAKFLNSLAKLFFPYKNYSLDTSYI